MSARCHIRVESFDILLNSKYIVYNKGKILISLVTVKIRTYVSSRPTKENEVYRGEYYDDNCIY